jgi:hypothetical protein
MPRGLVHLLRTLHDQTSPGVYSMLSDKFADRSLQLASHRVMALMDSFA